MAAAFCGHAGSTAFDFAVAVIRYVALVGAAHKKNREHYQNETKYKKTFHSHPPVFLFANILFALQRELSFFRFCN